MATLGFTTDIRFVPAWKIDSFMLIDSEVERLNDQKAKKGGKK